MPATHGSPEEKESLLREDIRLLGRILGDVIRSRKARPRSSASSASARPRSATEGTTRPTAARLDRR